MTLTRLIHEITDIPITDLHGARLSEFSVHERLQWAAKRDTKRKEDKAYCLQGIFDIFIPLMYGEGDNAFVRLKEEIGKRSGSTTFRDPRRDKAEFTRIFRDPHPRSLDGDSPYKPVVHRTGRSSPRDGRYCP